MARKLNKAVVGAVAGVAVLAGGVYVSKNQIVNYFRPISKLQVEADDAQKKGDYETAAVIYGKIANRSPGDIDAQLRYVDAVEYTVNGDIDKLRALRGQQAAVLANDPRSVPALRKVLNYQRVDVQQNPSDTAAIRSLVGTAERLEKLVPGDRDARLARIVAVAEPFARNFETRAEDVDVQRDEADKLLAEKPDDVEAAFYAGQFRSVAVQRAVQANDTADATDKLTKAVAFIDEAVKKSPDNAGAWVARSDMYRMAPYLLTKDDAKRMEYGKAYYDSLLKAAEVVKPDGQLAIPIRTAALRQQELVDPKAAESGYRRLLADRPDDRQARLFLAEFLARQPNRRDEAVAELEKPFKATGVIKGKDSVDQRMYGVIEQVRKVSFRLGALALVNDPAERKKRMDVIEAEYRTLKSDTDVANRFKAAVTRIQGGVELAQNKITDAITTLDAALKLMDPASPSSIEQDMRNDTLMEFAQAQLRLNQTGEARPALEELVQRRPENLMARAMLADVYVNERNFERAAREIDVLKKRAPDAPLVQNLDLRLKAAQGSLAGGYKDLAEDTRPRQLAKLQAAATLNRLDEVKRLAKKMLAADAADFEAAATFVQAALATNARAEAIVVVDAALAKKPDDARLKNMRTGLDAETQQQREQYTAKVVGDIKDPYEKALAESDLARRLGKPADAIGFLKQAQKLRPDDPKAYDAQFTAAVTAGLYADAESVLGDLSRTNADQAGGALRRVQLAAARAVTETDRDRRATMFKDVVRLAQAAAQDNPNLASAAVLYAQVLAQAGDVSGAIDQYAAALDKSPTNVEALIGRADCLLRTDRRADAKAALDTAAAVAARDGRIAGLQLDYELKFGDPVKAVDSLQKQVEADPANVATTARLGLALEQVAAGKKPEEAKPFQERAAKVYADAFARFPQDMRFLAAYAEMERRVGNPAAAEQAVEKAAADPANAGRPEVRLLLADTYTKNGKSEEAKKVLAEAISATKPPPVEAVTRLAGVLLREGKLEDALAVLDQRGDDPAVRRQRVLLLLEANQIDAARQAAEAAVKASDDADTNLLLAQVYLRAGDAAGVERCVDKVLATRPNDILGLFYRGQVRANTPDKADAGVADLQKARDLAPNSPEIRLALAEVFRRRGDRDASITELQTAWSANKTNKLVLLRLIDAYSKSTPPAWSAVQQALTEAKSDPTLANDVDVRMSEAEMFAARNDAPRAVAAADAVVKLAPDNPGVRLRAMDVLLRAKAYREVLTQTGGDLGTATTDWWKWRARAIALRFTDQRAEAQKSFDTAFDLAGKTASPDVIAAVARSLAEAFGPKAAAERLSAYNSPALVLMSAGYTRDGGDLPAAAAKFEEVVALRDKGVDPAVVRQAMGELGVVYLQTSPPQPAKARPMFEELVKVSPNDPALLNNYACTLLMDGSGGDAAEALKAAQSAFDIVSKGDAGPTRKIFEDTLGWAMVKSGKLAEGTDVLRRAAEGAQFPDVFLHLAEACLMANDVSGAESALVDAQGQIQAAERRKQPIDPMTAAKYQQLADDAAKKKAAGG